MEVNKRQRLLMVSFDAVSSNDLSSLMGMPNFASLCKRGTLVRNVDSVVVSNTYPAHTSIITGVHPAKHGIVENLYCSPGGKRQPWRYHVKDIKAPTLYDRVAAQGGKVCSILYPVTGGASINYNFPEIAGDMPMYERIWKIFSKGSPWFILSCFLRCRRHFKGMAEPELDDFTTEIACDTWQRQRPDLLMLHLIDVDSHKHDYGPNSEQAVWAMERLDRRLGKLLSAIEKVSTDEQVSVIVFSDHGCRAVHTAVEPNAFLEQYDWPFSGWFHNAGGTTFLSITSDKPVSNEALHRFITDFLKEGYVHRQLSCEEMRRSGMDKEFIVGFEAVAGFSFGKKYLGQHGYASHQFGDEPFYLAVGENIPQGAELTGGCIIDICPLAADILRIPKWDMEGINRLEMVKGRMEK